MMMNPDPDSAFALLKMIGARLGGAFAGTIISLAVIPPKTRREARDRSISALFGGLAFPVLVRMKLGLQTDFEGLIASGAAAAFLTWWVAGAVVRLVEKRANGKK